MSCVRAFWHAARRRKAGSRRIFGQGEPRAAFRLALVGLAALATANCSGPPQVASHRRSASATIDPKYGVTASPRVVAENDPVPKGGGRQLVGRPYVIAGKTYVPRENPSGYVREGLASWYGTAFHGRLTANREIFDRYSIAAAHPTLPLPSYARVTNLTNNASMIVRVNDRGPYHAGRLMDVSERVAEALDFRRLGTSRVRVEYVGKASLRGSDDSKLIATLRTDGRPASFPGQTPTMLADAGDKFESRAEPARTALAFKPESEAEPSPAPVMSKPAVLAVAAAPTTTAYPYEPVVRETASKAPAVAVAHAPVMTVVASKSETTSVIPKRVQTLVATRTAAGSRARVAGLRPADRLTMAENVRRVARMPASKASAPKVATPVRVAAAPLPPGRPTGLDSGRNEARSSRAKVAGVY